MKLLTFLTLFLFLSDSLTSEGASVKYVTPNGGVACPDSEQRPCQTLDVYASESANVFINNSIFYFLPGNHRLNGSLTLINVKNLSLQGLPPDNQNLIQVVNILLGRYSITWERCSNVAISSITFQLIDTFTFSIVFRQTHLVQLSKIAVFGNGHSGCSLIVGLQSTINVTNTKFIGIQGWLGAAISLQESKMFVGNSTFAENKAASGGGIYLFESTLVMTGANLFKNNTSLAQSYKQVCYHPLRFRRYTWDDYSRYGRAYGGAILCNSCTIKIYAHIHFTNNTAIDSGGALMVDRNGSATIQGTILFDGNFANASGGAIMATSNSTLKVCGNITFVRNTSPKGGALALNSDAELWFEKDPMNPLCLHSNNFMSFRQNTGKEGGAIWSYCNSYVMFNAGSILFDQNTAHDGGAISNIQDSNIIFRERTRFSENSASQGAGGAIVSIGGNISFQGGVIFERNTAYSGGAMALLGDSNLILVPTLNISFVMNSANITGGAIHIGNNPCNSYQASESLDCMEYNLSFPIRNISLYFVNNSAGYTGSTLFGKLNKCKPCYKPSDESDFCNIGDYSEPIAAFMSLSTIILNKNSVTNISSTAERITVCPESKEIHSLYYTPPEYTFWLHPGKHFNVPLAAYGQYNVPISTRFFIENNRDNHYYNTLSSASQILGNSCSNISFQLHTIDVNIEVFQEIHIYDDCQNKVPMYLRIFIVPCPLGFDLSKKEQICVCDKHIKHLTPKCYIDNYSIERKQNTFWISKNNYDDVTIILHRFRCPLDYCKVDSVNVTLNKPYVQCDFNRDGTLCGKCQKGFSLAFGSLHCVLCKNNSIALILLFAVIGIALVAAILLLRLTIAIGTLNGLIFYANVIQANHQAFFPRATINFSTIFISWLNLDLGIEACFYDGMDIYAYSWLQFLFPVYVWFLIGFIILLSHYSQSFAKHLGTNPVAVLATLLLISYSKIIKAIIAPLSWTYLTYYNSTMYAESHRTVWLYDGSIDFFREPKHFTLGLFAIISLVVFVIPYISLLLFGQWLQRYSNWWILSWLNRIKPFTDAYHAPYQKHTRYWIGLLLLARLGLFLIFAINANGSESINILAVSSVAIALLAMKSRVYERLYNDILESVFILNLGIFSVATFYLKDSEINNQFILSNISIAITFSTFIGILVFHICLVLKSISLWKVHLLPYIKRTQFLCTIFSITQVEERDLIINKNIGNIELQSLPTSTVVDVDLREPFLDVNDSM